MNMDIWEIGASSELFIRGSYTQIKFKKKKKVVSAKTAFFVMVHFLLPILFVLSLAFDRAILNGNAALSIVVLLTKTGSPVFQKGFCFSKNLFQKTCFKV